MTREIKFRGKRVDNGEWVYGFLAGFVNNGAVACISTPEQGVGKGCHTIPETVGQLVRSFGDKELYEGDILECWHDDVIRIDDDDNEIVDGSDKKICVVRWGGFDYPAFDIRYEDVGYGGKEIWNPLDDEYNAFSNADNWHWEVVGNIHDNPELMKGGE